MVEMPVEGHGRPSFPALATDRARHVGDPVAIVLASSRHVAEDAAALVLVDYEPLAPVATAEQAADPASTPLFDELESNVVYRGSSEFGDVDGAFAAAAHVVTGTFRQQRSCNVPLETRGGIADFDAAAGGLTYTASTQNPHGLRFALASLLGLSLGAVRVISGDVGGGFGQKMVVYPRGRGAVRREPHRRAPGEVDRGSRRAPHRCRPGARRHDRARGRGLGRRRDPGAARAHRAGSGRLSRRAVPGLGVHGTRARACCPTHIAFPRSRSRRWSSRRTRLRTCRIAVRGARPRGRARCSSTASHGCSARRRRRCGCAT